MSVDAALLDAVAAVARRAGEVILAVYARAGDIAVTGKQDDTPLTEADLAAHRVIAAGLAMLGDGWPQLSEEDSERVPAAGRRRWSRYWLVDPLDGTREFIKRNGEFTVNIALIDNHRPVLGVVHAPVTGTCWLGLAGSGAWREEGGVRRRIHTRTVPAVPVVVASRSHGSSAQAALLADVSAAFGRCETLRLGSALKICRVAEGSADLYPRLGATGEWDTAAAQAVLEAAGGRLLGPGLAPLRCNTRDSLLNPDFAAVGCDDPRWQLLARHLGDRPS